MMSVPFAAGFLLRFLCIRLLVFGFFVCFSGSPDFPVAGRHCASLGCFFLFFFFFFLSGRRLRLRLSPSAFSFGFIFAFVFAFVWFRTSFNGASQSPSSGFVCIISAIKIALVLSSSGSSRHPLLPVPLILFILFITCVLDVMFLIGDRCAVDLCLWAQEI